MLYLLAQKVAGNRAAAATATALFALSPAWWSQATIVEVYALQGLFVVIFLYLLLRWEEVRSQETGGRGQGTGVRGQGTWDRSQGTGVRGQESGVRSQQPASSFQLPVSSDRWLAAAALVFGLGMAHHRMIALLLPAALFFIFWTDPSLIRQPRRWVTPLLCAFIPLVLYLYLPIRGQAVTSLDGTFVPTLAGTLDWVTRAGYSIFLTGNPFGVERSASTVIALFLDQLGVLTIGPRCWGWPRRGNSAGGAMSFCCWPRSARWRSPPPTRCRMSRCSSSRVYADRRVGRLGAGAALRRSGAAGDERCRAGCVRARGCAR